MICPCMLQCVHMKAGWLCQAQNKGIKSSIYVEKTVWSHGNGRKWGFCDSRESVGVIAHLTFALGHMSPEELPAERKQSQKALNVSEANHESELFIQKCWSLSKPFPRHYVFSNACMHAWRSWRPICSDQLSSCGWSERSHSFKWHNKIDVFGE